MLLGHLAVDKARFGRQQFAAALQHLTFAHAARTAAAACRRQEHVVVGQRRKQRAAALGDEHFLPAVDVDGDIARGGQFRLRKEKQPHENQGYHQKGNDRYDNC